MRAASLLILFAACAASLAFTAAPAATHTCKVPKLTGLTPTAARKALAKAGCPSTAFRKATACAPTAKVGIVLDQKPAPRTVLKKGRRVDVHVGIECAPPIAAEDLVGNWSGTYTGALKGDRGCPDIPIGGEVVAAITGTGFDEYTVSFALENGDVVTNSADCKELGRGTSSGNVAVKASAIALTGTGFKATLSAGTLTGSMAVTGRGGFTFTITRDS
jgi:hypothetical protein